MRDGNDQAGIHLLIGFQGTALDEELKSAIKGFHIGGIVIFKRNVVSPDQLKALLRDVQDYARSTLGRPLWVAVDQEGGPVQRFIPPFTQLPSAEALAREGEQAIVQWAETAARELRQVGVHINLAPVLDVCPVRGEPQFLKSRSLGTDPERVAALGLCWIATLQRNGVSATAKHYPGIGQAELDPHHFAPVIRWESEDAMQRDLLPFREVIQAGVDCVMTSHALYPTLDPQWPATLSPRINSAMLRSELGFEGVLLSDDMDMAAIAERYSWEEMVRQGLHSSIDFFLLCQNARNIEPFSRALHEVIAADASLTALHQASLRRIQRLVRRHDT